MDSDILLDSTYQALKQSFSRDQETRSACSLFWVLINHHNQLMNQNTVVFNVYWHLWMLIEFLNESLPLAFMVIIDSVFGLPLW